jgi:hypothetical protein
MDLVKFKNDLNDLANDKIDQTVFINNYRWLIRNDSDFRKLMVAIHFKDQAGIKAFNNRAQAGDYDQLFGPLNPPVDTQAPQVMDLNQVHEARVYVDRAPPIGTQLFSGSASSVNPNANAGGKPAPAPQHQLQKPPLKSGSDGTSGKSSSSDYREKMSQPQVQAKPTTSPASGSASSSNPNAKTAGVPAKKAPHLMKDDSKDRKSA